MNVTKHTPGPWVADDRHIHPDKGRLTYPPGIDPETDVIVLVDTDCHRDGLINDTDKANLRLIAAAPDLLEACKDAAEAFGHGKDFTQVAIVDQLERAIAKAEGRSE